MKHKILKMHWATWRNMRHFFPAVKDETMDDYCRRVVIKLARKDERREE